MKIEIIGTIFFAIAVVHTFLTSSIAKLSRHFPNDSFFHALFHLLGEIEVVFGFWAGVFFLFFAFFESPSSVIAYQESLSFTEPLFVFVIMIVGATRPILFFVQMIIERVSFIFQKIARTPAQFTDILMILILGPLIGSLITEPAAITVTALLIKNLARQVSKKLTYTLLAVLFVNISVGGALTPFAAPPILMVAKTWAWDFNFVFLNFGFRSIATVVINSLLFVLFFRKELAVSFYSLKELSEKRSQGHANMSAGIVILHLIILLMIVLTAHHQSVFMGIFLFFLGITVATKKYHDQLRFRESLLVAFFLGGLVVFGAFQRWWLQPLLTSLSDGTLFYGSVALTAIVDNAALTYLGSQVQTLTESSKYALVAGALTGGGLTIIANAPNAAGYSILSDLFPGKIISPLNLLLAALPPTAVAVICFYII